MATALDDGLPAWSLLAAFGFGAVGCSSSRHYSEADVERAFRSHGFDLKVGTVDGRKLRKGGDVLLAPSSKARFWVAVIHDNKQARSYYREYIGQKATWTSTACKRTSSRSQMMVSAKPSADR